MSVERKLIEVRGSPGQRLPGVGVDRRNADASGATATKGRAADRIRQRSAARCVCDDGKLGRREPHRSEEHTSELQSLMRISYAVFCLKKKKKTRRYKYQTHKQNMQ